MVYRRKIKREGKVIWAGQTWYFDGLLRDGRRKQLTTGTTSKPLGQRIAAMWESLAVEHRAWDLLQLVLEGTLPMGRLYDLWYDTRYNPLAMRARVREVDLEPLVAEWHRHHAGNVKADSARHALVHVRALIPEGKACLAASIDVRRLTQFLTAYPGKRNTRRKVHSSLAGFFAYATKVHGAFAVNPMDEVDRPTQEESPIRFYELDEVERIVAWQPTAQRRALMALFYGTAIEASLPQGLTRRDFFDVDQHLLRMAGTKARTRDRIGRVADWAWPIVWEYIRGFLPDAKPWEGISRYTASDWHHQTVGWTEETKQGLNLTRRYPLHCARDHWAATRLRAGASVQTVADQLGHGDSNLTFKKYGRFAPSPADRARVEQQVTDYEAKRRGKTES